MTVYRAVGMRFEYEGTIQTTYGIFTALDDAKAEVESSMLGLSSYAPLVGAWRWSEDDECSRWAFHARSEYGWEEVGAVFAHEVIGQQIVGDPLA